MLERRFEGWYYKQRAGEYMHAFIPGRAAGGAFVQMIDSNGTRRFSMPDFVVFCWCKAHSNAMCRKSKANQPLFTNYCERQKQCLSGI